MVRTARALIVRALVVPALMVAAQFATVDAVVAAPVTKTWVGPNGSMLWSTPGNWSPAGAPNNGDSVVLPAGSTSGNDIPGLVIENLTATGPTTMGVPERVTIAGDVHVVDNPSLSYAGVQIYSPILDASDHNVIVDPNSGLLLGDTGPSSGATGSGRIVKSGAGSLGLYGDFAGDIDVQAGSIGGSFGLPSGKTVLRAGTLAFNEIYSPTEPFEVWPGTAANPTRMTATGPHTAPITLMDAGEFVISSSWGHLDSAISGPGHLTFTHSTPAGDLIIGGTNTYTGGTTIVDGDFYLSGGSPLGTGPVTLDGPGVGGLLVHLLPGTTLANDITVNGGGFTLADDGVAASPEIPGDLTINSTKSTLYLSQDVNSNQPAAVLSGAVGGSGTLDLESTSSSPVVLITGTAPNVNGGLAVGSGNFGPVTVLLAKPAGVTSIAGALDLGAGDVWWTNDEQIADSVPVHVHWLGSLDLDGATETMGDTIVDGAVSLSTLNSSSAGRLSVGDLIASPGAVLSMVVDDQASDSLQVRGTASIGGAVLDLQATPLTAGQFHTLVSVTGTQPVSGTFAGLPEGGHFPLGGADFEIWYRAGDGNDIVIGPVGATSLPEPPSATPFHAVSPVRVLETRLSEGQVGYVGARPVGGQVIELVVGGVPAGAGAVALNVTAVGASGNGFVTVWPCGEARPVASNLNFVAGQTVPNLVVSKLGAGGKVCLFSPVGVDLVADLQGWFPVSGFDAVSPVRVLETRLSEGQVGYVGARPVGGQVIELVVGGVPAGAGAVALNVTAVGASGNGFVTVWPCGEARPVASNLNFVAGQTVPNLVVSKLGAGGKVCLFSPVGVDLVADLQGWFPVSGFDAVSPVRVLETRLSEGQVGYVGARPVGGQVIELVVGGVPAGAGAVALNVTAVGASGNGFVTVWPCGEARPVASNLNFVAGQTVPNLVVSKLGAGGKVCLFSPVGVDLVADLQGWFPA